MKTVLVIGANGFSGRRILNDLSEQSRFQVAGCSLRDDQYPDAVSSSYRFYRADIRKKDVIESLFDEVRPEVVINAAALSVPDFCETHREEAFLSNVTAVRQLACACQQWGARLIHLSTDFVFDGRSDRPYRETDLPCPVNYYGVTKINGEQSVAAYCNNHAIVRVAIVYGTALPGQHGNIFQLSAHRLRSGETLQVVSDQWRTPTFVGDVSKGVELLIDRPLRGIFHIAGEECLTVAEIAYRVADFLDLDRSLIHPVSTYEMNEATPRPRYSALNIHKARTELLYHPCSIEEGMRRMFS